MKCLLVVVAWYARGIWADGYGEGGMPGYGTMPYGMQGLGFGAGEERNVSVLHHCCWTKSIEGDLAGKFHKTC